MTVCEAEQEKAYLSGPMSGLPGYNRQAFVDAEEALKKRGFEVYNPARSDDDTVLAEIRRTQGEDAVWRYCLRRDILRILQDGFTSIRLIPEWQQSRGALIESLLCRMLGIPVMQLDDTRVELASLLRACWHTFIYRGHRSCPPTESAV